MMLVSQRKNEILLLDEEGIGAWHIKTPDVYYKSDVLPVVLGISAWHERQKFQL